MAKKQLGDLTARLSAGPKNILKRLDTLAREVRSLHRLQIPIRTLEDLTNSMGLQEAGEFRTGNGASPGAGFTGGRFGYPGFTYDGIEFFLAGVVNDVIQVGLALADGKMYFGAGAGFLDVSGMTLKNTSGKIYFQLASGVGNIGLMYGSADNDIAIQNSEDGKNILFQIEIGANAPSLVWGESPVWTDVAQLKFGAGPVGSVFTMFGNTGKIENQLWGEKTGTENLLNGEGRDIDTRIEGDTDANLFMVDASTDRVGIGTATPAVKLHVVGDALITGAITGGLNAPQGFLVNGKIVPSVATSDLTVAIKTLAGANPSASDPVYVRIGDTVRTITAALSVTKNDATNWFNAGSAELATKEIDYFVYLGYNATDGVVIGFSRIPYAKRYGDFSATTTNEKYAAISTITTAAAADYYEVVGRFAATLSAGAGYTWTVPTFTALNLINRPIFETRLLDWVPVHSRTGTAYTNLPSTSFAKYLVSGRNIGVREVHLQNATPGGTGSQQFTIPFVGGQSNLGLVLNANSTVLLLGYVNVTNLVVITKYDGTAEVTASQFYVYRGDILVD